VKPRRALPSFARWGTRLWAFSYRNVTYFASPDASERWQVVAEHGHHDHRTGKTHCREDRREIPAAERDAPYRPVRE